MFKNIKITPKLILCFTIVVLISSISGIIGTGMLIKTDRNYSAALIENGFSQGDIGSFNTYFVKGGAVVRDIIMLTNAEEIKTSQQELAKIEQNVSDELAKLKVNCKTADELALIKIIDEKMPVYNSYKDQVIALGLENKNEEALSLFHNDARPVLNEIQTAAEELAALNEVIGQSVSDKLTRQSNNSILGIMIIIMISFAVSMLFAIIIAKTIAVPIIKVRDAAARLAEGDLKIDIKAESKDEIGDMTNSFAMAADMIRRYIADISSGLGEVARSNFDVDLKENYKGDFKEIERAISTIITSLSDTLRQINEASGQVSSGAEQVSIGAQALSQGSTEQASAVEELAATINEISVTINSNADNAKNASSKVTEVGDEVSTSNKHMDGMLGAMNDITKTSAEIQKIIKTIEDIAFQTNILALNAAVEAARAGAAGKGFAVVADEVRNLAGKSAEASKNTSALIEKSLSAVANGTHIADSTAKSLAGVVSGVNDITDVITKISQASLEQASSVNQVTIGIDQISSVVQTNSATAEESAAASEELSGQSQMLKDLVGQFKLKRDIYESGHTGTYTEHYQEPTVSNTRVSHKQDFYEAATGAKY